MEEQPARTDVGEGVSTQVTTDQQREQALFSQWLLAARNSDDARNRIAVAGGKLSQGVFGKHFLRAPARPPIGLTNSAALLPMNAPNDSANDEAFEQVIYRNSW